MKCMFSDAFVKGFERAVNLSGTKEWPDISNSQKKIMWH